MLYELYLMRNVPASTFGEVQQVCAGKRSFINKASCKTGPQHFTQSCKQLPAGKFKRN